LACRLSGSAGAQDERRYIVAYYNLSLADGTPVQPSEAFRALRDGLPSDDPAVEARRTLFEDIFARLEAAGVPRGSLQLAWDYSTASMDSIAGRLVAMRDDAFARLPADGRPRTGREMASSASGPR